jgi:DNA-binding IscR family transcriptional regulator
VWVKVRDSIIDAIDSITLADLLAGPAESERLPEKSAVESVTTRL